MCTDCVPPMELSETGHMCIDPVSYNCKPGIFIRNAILIYSNIAYDDFFIKILLFCKNQPKLEYYTLLFIHIKFSKVGFDQILCNLL